MEPVVTTVTDKEVSEDEELISILKNLCDNMYPAQISFDDPDNPNFTRKCDSARIMKVEENTVDIHAFFNGASAKYSNVSIWAIKSIKLVATKQMLSNKYQSARFYKMDVAEI